MAGADAIYISSLLLLALGIMLTLTFTPNALAAPVGESIHDQPDPREHSSLESTPDYIFPEFRPLPHPMKYQVSVNPGYLPGFPADGNVSDYPLLVDFQKILRDRFYTSDFENCPFPLNETFFGNYTVTNKNTTTDPTSNTTTTTITKMNLGVFDHYLDDQKNLTTLYCDTKALIVMEAVKDSLVDKVDNEFALTISLVKDANVFKTYTKALLRTEGDYLVLLCLQTQSVVDFEEALSPRGVMCPMGDMRYTMYTQTFRNKDLEAYTLLTVVDEDSVKIFDVLFFVAKDGFTVNFNYPGIDNIIFSALDRITKGLHGGLTIDTYTEMFKPYLWKSFATRCENEENIIERQPEPEKTPESEEDDSDEEEDEQEYLFMYQRYFSHNYGRVADEPQGQTRVPRHVNQPSAQPTVDESFNYNGDIAINEFYDTNTNLHELNYKVPLHGNHLNLTDFARNATFLCPYLWTQRAKCRAENGTAYLCLARRTDLVTGMRKSNLYVHYKLDPIDSTTLLDHATNRIINTDVADDVYDFHYIDVSGLRETDNSTHANATDNEAILTDENLVVPVLEN